MIVSSDLLRGTRFRDVDGSWTIIQVHPPFGRRRHYSYTVLNNDTSQAWLVEENDLLSKENNLELLKD